jgi:hypothetical protein
LVASPGDGHHVGPALLGQRDGQRLRGSLARAQLGVLDRPEPLPLLRQQILDPAGAGEDIDDGIDDRWRATGQLRWP